MAHYKTVVAYITEEQAVEEWLRAWHGGKHGDWGDKPDEMPGLGRDWEWVLAQIPMEWLRFDWELEGGPGPVQQKRAAAYAARFGNFPPGVALFNKRSERRQNEMGEAPRAYVADGNHRGLAAAMRGDETFAVLMPHSDFERLERLWLTLAPGR